MYLNWKYQHTSKYLDLTNIFEIIHEKSLRRKILLGKDKYPVKQSRFYKLFLFCPQLKVITNMLKMMHLILTVTTKI